jgi:hypothetical protein
MIMCSRRQRVEAKRLCHTTRQLTTYLFVVDGFLIALHTLKFIFPKWEVKYHMWRRYVKGKSLLILYIRPLYLQK